MAEGTLPSPIHHQDLAAGLDRCLGVLRPRSLSPEEAAMKFVSLHHHSTFSYQDGLGLPAEHVERAAEYGMRALALTDHGNVSSHVQLEYAAKAAGIKPIF